MRFSRDRFLRASLLVEFGDRIAEPSARIQAVTWELLELIRRVRRPQRLVRLRFVRRVVGLADRARPGRGREHVRVARALANLPTLSDAMRPGKVSYSKVRAITRVATPETEDDLLNVALSGTAAHVENAVAAHVGGRGRDGGGAGPAVAGGRGGRAAGPQGGVRPSARPLRSDAGIEGHAL